MRADQQNPYAPPSSEPLPPPVGGSGRFLLASPWIRLGSAIIDGIINLAIFHVTRVAFSMLGVSISWDGTGEGSREIRYGMALLGVLIFYAVHWHWLSVNGQTIGKKLVRIRIATMTGEKPSMTDLVIKRYGFISVLNFIPFVGAWIGLVDSLCIFRKNHRCLHDEIAGTQVVRIVE